MRFLFYVFAAASSASTLSAQGADRADDSVAVLTVATAMLRAISTNDAALAKASLLPGARLTGIMDPGSAATPARSETDSGFIAILASGKAKYTERMWNPTLFLQGSIALVHAPYDFHLDGKFSHCGVDTFTLVKSGGAWRIAYLAYTVQLKGCTPSPLGAP